MRIIYAAIGICLLLTQPAWAYLDPGTGNLLLQGIIAALATVSVSISLGWRYIKNAVGLACRRWFKRTGGDSGKQQDNE